MQLKLIDYLACPQCYNNVVLMNSIADTHDNNSEIMSGDLVCNNCKINYPIIRGIPRFILENTLKSKNRTAAAFGWEWQKFSHLHSIENYTEQFLDWIEPIRSDFFMNKIVLDAGCGMGRFAQVAGLFKAKEVLAIDLSDAVEPAYFNTRHLDNVHVIQADIYNLPLAKQRIDFIYSIGVLHHLPNPEAGFHSLIQHIKPKGAIFAWVYGYENNGWIIWFINPLRKLIFSRLPKLFLYWLAWLFTLGLHPIIKLLYSSVRKPNGEIANSVLPYSAYLSWLAQYSFLHTHHVVFDHLVAPTAFYIKQNEFALWFAQARLENVIISWRNKNSWRGFGTIPE